MFNLSDASGSDAPTGVFVLGLGGGQRRSDCRRGCTAPGIDELFDIFGTIFRQATDFDVPQLRLPPASPRFKGWNGNAERRSGFGTTQKFLVAH